MPQYQGVWTLPVAARLQSNQQWATDPLYRNTTLLLQADNAPNGAQNNTFIDSSSNNFTITRNGNTTQGTFTPFSATGWGNYFDGTGDYLTVPANAAFNFGTGDFTIDFWYYPNDVAGAKTLVEVNYGTAPNFIMQPSSGVMNFYTNGTATSIISSAVDTAGSWYHYAVVRSGSTITMYRNGISVGTTTYSGNVGNSSVSCFIGGSLGGGGLYINGYLSNFRIVKGTAVYTANFNPSTSPLTAITNTSLLTCQSNRFVDNSTNAFALTVNGNTSVQAFSPFAPQYQWTAPVIGGSGYFDGTGDYLTASNNAALQLGSSDFTIEGWFYFTQTPNSYNALCQKGIAGDSNLEYAVFLRPSSNTIEFGYSTNGSTYLFISSSSVTINQNAWYHVAVTRSVNTLYFFLNGVAAGSSSFTSTLYTGTASLGIAASNSGTNILAAAYLSNLRIVKGTAVYTAAFTPPTAPLTAITNTSLLLNFTNAGIVDGTMKNNLETVGNAQVNTSIVKYGTGSMAFNGSSGYLFSNVNMPQFAFGTGNFTIEYWIYFNTTAQQGVIGFRPATTNGAYPNMYFISSSLKYVVNGVEVLASSSLSTGVWYHIAVSRSETSTRLFVNGVQQGSAYTDTTNYLASRLVVGADDYSIGTTVLNGYLDDLRITRFARYTANFTPPTVALPRQ